MACRSEHEEQVLLCHWLKKEMPDLLYFAIPNGGHRNKVTAYKLKMEGVKSGVPDMFFPSLRLFIEMKKENGGTVSSNQKDWIKKLQDCGYKAVVCRGHTEAVEIIKNDNQKKIQPE